MGVHLGVSVEGQCCKLLPVMTTCHMRPAALPHHPYLIQVPANTSGKSAENGPSSWDPAAYKGETDGV